MTTQKLYEVLSLMVTVNEELRLQSSLNQVRDNLNQLVNSPAATQYQSALASALTSLSTGAEKLRQRIAATQWSAIAELGGSEFFNPTIAETVRGAVERNAMTPSVARDFVQNLATKRETFLSTVSSTLQGLTKLLESEERDVKLPPADAAFSIPRDLFGNTLSRFAQELKFINQLLEHLGEAATGQVSSVELEGLSSSTPTIAVLSSLKVLKLLGTVVNSFLEAWEKVQKIRGLREELKDVGVTTAAVEELTERIETTVEEVVEESIAISLEAYSGEAHRRNELENALKLDMRRLFGQIERGLTVEIRTHADGAAEDEKDELTAIDQIAQNMRFPAIPKEPMLLAPGEVLEGDIARVKKVTKRSTTTTTARRKSAGVGASEAD